MKKYLLDADTVILFLKGQEAIVKKIEKTPSVQLYVSAINCAELLYGANNSSYPGHNLKMMNGLISHLNIAAFDLEAAKVFGEQKVLLKKQDELIADIDIQVASIAIAGDYLLVTNNKNFAKIKKLKSENWSES